MVQWLSDILHSPFKILWICFISCIVLLVGEGSLFRLWNLYHDEIRMIESVSKLNDDFKVLNSQFRRVNDPDFIEHEVRDRLDLASEGELIFVFSDN